MRNRITAQYAATLISLKLQECSIQAPQAADGALEVITPQRTVLTIVSLLPQKGSGAKFVLPSFQDSPLRFIVCTEQDETGAPIQWVFPEMTFTHRGVAREDGTAEVDLDLPGEGLRGSSIRGGLYYLQERWDPIIQFDDFQEYMLPPDRPEFGERWVDFEEILELIWFRENPEPTEDAVPTEEFPDQEGAFKIRVSDQVVDFINQVPEKETAEILDAIRSIQEDPYSPDTLGIGGERGSYRILWPERN